MSANTEILRVPTVNLPKLSLYVRSTATLRRWSTRLQLGSSAETAVGRHSGARC